jgi:hypothetical protein
MQFGNVLPRHVVLAYPSHGPVQLIKVDIADGFYRIVGVRPPDVLKLGGVAFPTKPNQPQLLVFPITLPMGWTNSPPIFCAATETSIADLANEGILKWRNPPPHRLDDFASTPVPGPCPPDRQCREDSSSSTTGQSISATSSVSPGRQRH